MVQAPAPPRSYAYCSDTAFWEPLADFIRGADLLYHESTFLNSEKLRAHETMHSTAEQAARMAVLSGARSLLLGHFSSRYDDMGMFYAESVPVFSAVKVAEEGCTYEVPLGVPEER
jgi:ribonuclease Z